MKFLNDMYNKKNEKILFKEEQKFRQWWWLRLIFMAGVSTLIMSLIKLINNGSLLESYSLSMVLLIISSLILLGLPIVFFNMRLVTVITAEQIKLTINPFFKKVLSIDDVYAIGIINYGFPGGWGMYFFSDYGTIWNSGGRIGLYITMNDGEKFTVETKRYETLSIVIDTLETIHKKKFRK